MMGIVCLVVAERNGVGFLVLFRKFRYFLDSSQKKSNLDTKTGIGPKFLLTERSKVIKSQVCPKI